MATMTPTTYSWTSPSWTCWSQSGSTTKYESSQGPSCSTSGFSITNGSGSSKYNYSVAISSSTVNNYTYTLPSGYEASSSGSLTYTVKISPSITTKYGGVSSSKTGSLTLTYKYKSSVETISISLKPSKSTGKVTWSGSTSGTNPGTPATTTFTCQLYLVVTNNGSRTEIGNISMKGAVGYTSSGWQATVSYSNSLIKSTSSLSGTVLSLPEVTLNINSVAYSIHLSLSFS